MVIRSIILNRVLNEREGEDASDNAGLLRTGSCDSSPEPDQENKISGS